MATVHTILCAISQDCRAPETLQLLLGARYFDAPDVAQLVIPYVMYDVEARNKSAAWFALAVPPRMARCAFLARADGVRLCGGSGAGVGLWCLAVRAPAWVDRRAWWSGNGCVLRDSCTSSMGCMVHRLSIVGCVSSRALTGMRMRGSPSLMHTYNTRRRPLKV